MAKKKTGRKKDSEDNSFLQGVKQPLVFIESPLEGKKYYSSPIQAALRPYLAPSIPVDEEICQKWVSPQFSTQDEDGVCRRRTRRRKKLDIATERDVQSSSCNPTRKVVYKPLDFGKTQSDKMNCQRSVRRSERLKVKGMTTEEFLNKSLTSTPDCNSAVLVCDTPMCEILKKRKERGRSDMQDRQ